MAYEFQVVVDATDPHTLADWWALTLGWTVEPSDEDFIRRMVAEGYASEEETTTHNGVLVWKTGAAIRHPDSPLGGDGTAPLRRVLFQWVPEAKIAKNRMHLDVRVGPDKREETVAALTERGATFLHRGQQGPVHRWVTMADIEGNEFCVA